MGFCLLIGDVERARATLERGKQAGAALDDLVYAALWLTMLEEQLGAGSEGSARAIFDQAASSKHWIGALASWGLGKIGDGELSTAAQSPSNKIEANFYVAMRARAKGKDPSVDALTAVAKSGLFDRVEVDVARELTAPPVRVVLPKGIHLP